ncbi:hypothetical protein LOK49_LG05G03542 [Camellia lanceoleosa]|uniref:Uncharacterized protein n=1 Tax=Camellia lanceoleosa TaxID=1840588 RepID=A0ACC0HK32_9ERIC|nr:hypothetical protein LOK49_LG05G03542 [Camellia lanceoleosa]
MDASWKGVWFIIHLLSFYMQINPIKIAYCLFIHYFTFPTPQFSFLPSFLPITGFHWDLERVVADWEKD